MSVDMAVGIIIGAAFGKIVESLVKDVIMPPIGLMLGKVDFSNLFLVLRQGTTAGPHLTIEAAQEVGAVTLNYGLFINTMISFVIVAFAVFLLIRAINPAVADAPERLNQDPYAAWLFRLQPADPLELEKLLDAAAYSKMVGEVTK